ncbi:MAG: aminotransferase class I/II-fold pyridoxal phosphate-dependent enzyme [Leptolyngbya sp. PLA1]|nr:aminotransferase class I/II-fold pyridoxal phosphate-dependent enzyme [Leptolyngbya sp. PLA1]
MTSPIDLRSDTVTRPTPAMREAMMAAPLGDDVLGDDPTVAALEAKFAAWVGKPAACFVPTGTMANQVAIRAHTEHGDEIICHEDSHIVQYETGAPAALSGCMVRLLRGPRGQFTAADVAAAIRPQGIHGPASKLVVVENTQNRGGGSVWPLDRCREIAALAHERGLRAHLDGARLWNASVASGVPMSTFAAEFDSVSCCFSKGLGAPVGSALAGSAEFIARVRRFRKMFGGGMRQSGVLAAAAIYAMDNHISRLAQDHENAKLLAKGIASIPGLALEPEQAAGGVETNIVYFDLAPSLPFDGAALVARLKSRGVLVLATAPRRIRALTHLDVTRSQVEEAIAGVRAAVAS